jgi:SAM-dependent methyltransferase
MSGVSEASRIWALGDFPRVARETIVGTGEVLVAACAIGPGQRVLDVAAGAGNVALPAARAGARVVASDITPELLAAGRARAAAEGLELDWVEADAQRLPFGDALFDVVTSSFGAMFAPDHVATARELLRVCRPGGTIGLLNWTPEGWVGGFFRTLAPFAAPPPPGALPPPLWGHEPHVRTLLEPGCASLSCERRVVAVDRFADPAALVAYYGAHFGPLIAARARLAGDPERTAELEGALLDHAVATNLAPAGQPARWEFEYLLVVGRRAAV